MKYLLIPVIICLLYSCKPSQSLTKNYAENNNNIYYNLILNIHKATFTKNVFSPFLAKEKKVLLKFFEGHKLKDTMFFMTSVTLPQGSCYLSSFSAINNNEIFKASYDISFHMSNDGVYTIAPNLYYENLLQNKKILEYYFTNTNNAMFSYLMQENEKYIKAEKTYIQYIFFYKSKVGSISYSVFNLW